MRLIAVTIEVQQVTDIFCLSSFGLGVARMVSYQIKVSQQNLDIEELLALCPDFASCQSTITVVEGGC